MSSPSEARAAFREYRDFKKMSSWLVLHIAGLPALDGLIVPAWDLAAERAIRVFAARWKNGEILVRTDVPAETGSAPRGGYLVDSDRLEEQIRPLLVGGRAVFLLEPVSPFIDLYSVSLEPDAEWRRWDLEVVGAGFDASDLKRGDVTPHEQLRAEVTPDGADIVDREVAPAEVLAAGRLTRMEKAATLLGCREELVEDCLRRRGETMLLDWRDYQPIPGDLVSVALDQAARLRPELQGLSIEDHGLVLSMSFIGERARPVFWDIVWPRAKYLGSFASDTFGVTS